MNSSHSRGRVADSVKDSALDRQSIRPFTFRKEGKFLHALFRANDLTEPRYHVSVEGMSLRIAFMANGDPADTEIVVEHFPICGLEEPVLVSHSLMDGILNIILLDSKERRIELPATDVR